MSVRALRVHERRDGDSYKLLLESRLNAKTVMFDSGAIAELSKYRVDSKSSNKKMDGISSSISFHLYVCRVLALTCGFQFSTATQIILLHCYYMVASAGFESIDISIATIHMLSILMVIIEG